MDAYHEESADEQVRSGVEVLLASKKFYWAINPVGKDVVLVGFNWVSPEDRCCAGAFNSKHHSSWVIEVSRASAIRSCRSCSTVSILKECGLERPKRMQQAFRPPKEEEQDRRTVAFSCGCAGCREKMVRCRGFRKMSASLGD